MLRLLVYKKFNFFPLAENTDHHKDKVEPSPTSLEKEPAVTVGTECPLVGVGGKGFFLFLGC